MNMHPPDDDGRSEWDVTIIGAGIVGICCAVYLQEQGVRTQVVDRLPPGEACSYGNAGVLSSWSCIPDSMPGIIKSVPRWLLDPEGPLSIRWAHLPQSLPWLMKFIRAGRGERLQEIGDAMFALNNPTKELYEELTARADGRELIASSSYIHIFSTSEEAASYDRSWQLRRKRGAQINFLSGDEIREIEPAISNDYQSAVKISPQGHTMDPSRLVKVLFEYFISLGGAYVVADVQDFDPVSDVSIRLTTSTGHMTANKLIIAAGAWSGQFAARLGCRIPLQPQSGYHMTFAEPAVGLSNTIMEPKHKVVLTSMETGMRIAGMAEFAGLRAKPNPRYCNVLTRIAKRILPDLDTARGSDWMGHRPCTPDTLPVIGQAPGFTNIYFAFGHGHHGLSGAPMTGRIVTALVTGHPAPIDITPYRPDRF